MEGESREMLKIGDIYAGKPDAGDEIKECGYEELSNLCNSKFLQLRALVHHSKCDKSV